jgi:preprotein translocase subunit SecA
MAHCRSYGKLVRQANAFEPALQALSDEALRAKTVEFRQRLSQGAAGRTAAGGVCGGP